VVLATRHFGKSPTAVVINAPKALATASPAFLVTKVIEVPVTALVAAILKEETALKQRLPRVREIREHDQALAL
jgi:hypothetical protein